MSDGKIRTALAAAVVLFLTAGGGIIVRRVGLEALPVVARNSDEAARQAMIAEEAAQLGLEAVVEHAMIADEAARLDLDAAAKQAMTAERMAQIGLDVGKLAGWDYVYGQHQDGQNQASMAPQCSPSDDHADLRKELALCKESGELHDCFRYGYFLGACQVAPSPRDAMQVRAELRLAQRALSDWQAKENSHVPGGKRQYKKTLRRLEVKVNRLAKWEAKINRLLAQERAATTETGNENGQGRQGEGCRAGATGVAAVPPPNGDDRQAGRVAQDQQAPRAEAQEGRRVKPEAPG